MPMIGESRGASQDVRVREAFCRGLARRSCQLRFRDIAAGGQKAGEASIQGRLRSDN